MSTAYRNCVSFHVQLLQGLQPANNNSFHFHFCQCLLHGIVDESDFLWLVLLTDEGTFATCMKGHWKILLLHDTFHFKKGVSVSGLDPWTLLCLGSTW
jgi:hypothetical protein